MSRALRKILRSQNRSKNKKGYFYIQYFYPSKDEEAEKRVLEYIKEIGVSYWSFKDGSKGLVVNTSKKLQTPQIIKYQITGEVIGIIRPATNEEVEETKSAFENSVK